MKVIFIIIAYRKKIFNVDNKYNAKEDIYNKAIRETKQRELDELIKNISLNLQNAENEIREILIFTFDNDEKQFLDAINHKIIDIKEKYGKDWIKQWTSTRDKALTKNQFILYYSDLSQIRDILIWTKKEIGLKAIDNRSRRKVEDKIKKLVAFLQEYTTKDRNETFHSRLQHCDKDKINEILINTKRLIEIINDIKIDLEFI